jgi:Xaa-Pro aminopeptidase
VDYLDARTEKLRRQIILKKISALLITNIRNVRYLSDFTGSSAFALVTHSASFFYTDFRYQEQAGHEVRNFEFGLETGNRIAAIKELCGRLGIRKLGFESDVTYEFHEKLSKIPVALVPQKGMIEELRIIKDAEEIRCIKKAVRRAEDAFLAVKPLIRVGTTERKVALRLEEELKNRGCRRAAFTIIVASGRHSSMPHAGQTDKKIEAGDLVIIDWGGEADGYYSDMTRTLLMDGPGLSKKKRIYHLVNRAREKAIKAVSGGRLSAEIDFAARNFIREAGFGDNFGHGTGHGIGLEVHEAPRISWTTSRPLASGMVFSIEPGIYLEGLGGVRIEDLVLVEGGRGRVLTRLGRELEIVRDRKVK